MKDSLKICLIPLILYLLILFSVVFIPQITNIDIAVIKFTQKIFAFIPAELSQFISNFHYHNFKYILVIVTAFLLFKKDWFLAISYPALYLVNKNITHFVKDIVARPRPPIELQPLSHPHSASFHSGHSFSIMILFACLIYISNKYIDNKYLKNIINILLAVWILLVGLSRILLGVHYPTDVFGGYLFGLFFVIILIKIDVYFKNREKN